MEMGPIKLMPGWIHAPNFASFYYKKKIQVDIWGTPKTKLFFILLSVCLGNILTLSTFDLRWPVQVQSGALPMYMSKIFINTPYLLVCAICSCIRSKLSNSMQTREY